MAKHLVTVVVDDLTGEPLADGDHRQLSFSVQGKSYTIDLGKKAAAKFLAQLEPYIRAATPVGRPTAAAAAADRDERRRARLWATQHGYQVAPRGRISQEILAAFRAAQ